MTPRPAHLIAGAGLAGLSLACALLDAGVEEPITLVDRRTRYDDDRTWCFWDVGDLRFSHLARHRWAEWEIRTRGRTVAGTSARHPYVHLAAADVYAAAVRRLRRAPNVELRLGVRVRGLGEDGACAWVDTDAGRLEGAHVYDGLATGSPGFRAARADAEVWLWQTFLGQFVETPDDAFDPGRCVLMDFRVPAAGELRFVYLLPFGPRAALVEHTSIGAGAPPHSESREVIAAYLAEHCGRREWRVTREERGRVPMTDAPFRVRRGPRTTAVGTAGGTVRPSSGYAFVRTVRQAEAIARAVSAGARPPARAGGARRDALDRIFLHALRADPAGFPEHFAALVAGTPGDAFARFMADAGTAADEAQVIAALPKAPFAAAALRRSGSLPLAAGRRLAALALPRTARGAS